MKSNPYSRTGSSVVNIQIYLDGATCRLVKLMMF